MVYKLIIFNHVWMYDLGEVGLVTILLWYLFQFTEELVGDVYLFQFNELTFTVFWQH